MQDHKELRAQLERARRIAIVGAKDKPGQPVDRVSRYLMEKGYEIYPVHPVRQTVWGLTAYPHLASLPGPVDIVNLFRAPQYCPDHAREVLAPGLATSCLLDAPRHPFARSPSRSGLALGINEL